MTLAVTCRVADFAADPIKGFEMVFYCRKMGGKIDRRNEFWLKAIPNLEWGLAGCAMCSDIMSKLHKG